ncbi:MAG: serine--tRNA ligase [Candidatus Lokiarchaeota archaeon]|nr:serine--tRNA ligase [Candidatus Lokiarchaeota archaeon]
MLDIEKFRKNIDLIYESEKKRFKDSNIVDKVIEYDTNWRKKLQELNELRRQRNILSQDTSAMKLAHTPPEKIETTIQQSKEIGNLIPSIENEVNKLLEKRDEYRYKVGNLIHESVPVGENEDSNELIRAVGDLPKFSFDPLSHVNLIELIDGADIKRASKISGSRFYFLKNDIVLMNLALMQFALDFLISKGFIALWTPFFIKYNSIKAASELADFEEQLYKIQDQDLYMIATAEQTLAAYHQNEVIDNDQLPLKYAGISTCFRREAGAHGKDTLGIFRVHQFEKIEQFIFCKPEDSWNYHEELNKNTEDLYKQLEIPYRIVNIASGEMNDNAAKKYDLEGWFPASNAYRELGSCSNCLDYQARKLNIRFGKLGDPEGYHIIHTLNSTAIATERTICCILENYQNKDNSINIPKVLQKYMNNKKIIYPVKGEK